MSEKPFQKPDDGIILVFKDHAAQRASGPAATGWAGTDLARFAQDVVALNSQSRDSHTPLRCQVASLESMQRGLRIKKKAEGEASSAETPVDLSRFRKE